MGQISRNEQIVAAWKDQVSIYTLARAHDMSPARVQQIVGKALMQEFRARQKEEAERKVEGNGRDDGDPGPQFEEPEKPKRRRGKRAVPPDFASVRAMEEDLLGNLKSIEQDLERDGGR